jgi:hypothetical protein
MDKFNNNKNNNKKVSSSPNSNATVENKRYQNATLQKHIVDHDNLSIHSADVPTNKNINRHFSANLRKINDPDHITSRQQMKINELNNIQQVMNNDFKDLQPFYSSSLSSFQNNDAKSDSGNGSSCHETSKLRVTPTFRANEAHMTSSTTSTSSSSTSKQLSYDEQVNNSPKVTTNYKYTPLRQSWSNLNQFNQLSPFSMNQNEQDVDLISEQMVKTNSNNRKERPTSASNILLRTTNLLSALNDKTNTKRLAENDILNALSVSNDTSNNTIRSYSVNNGYEKDSPNENNRYSSLPRSTTSQQQQQTNAKLLTIPNKTRPYSAGSMTGSNSTVGLSIFKDSTNPTATTVQTIESKPLYNNKTAATIIANNNNNYNYAIESDYYDQFIDDNLPVKELDVSSSTISSVSSSIMKHNKKNQSTTPTNNMLSTYQKLRSSVQSGSYRSTASSTSSTVTNNNSSSSRKAVSVTSTKINGDSATASSYKALISSTGSIANGTGNKNHVTQSRKKPMLT